MPVQRSFLILTVGWVLLMVRLVIVSLLRGLSLDFSFRVPARLFLIFECRSGKVRYDPIFTDLKALLINCCF